MRRTRRDVLALVGTAGITSLAGCSGVLDSRGDDRPDLDAEALRAVERLGSPAFPARTPAPIETTLLETSRSRARTLLDSVPESMSSRTVPNEAVRNIYAEERADAIRALDRASTERTRFEQMRSLRYARGNAAMVKGTYEAAVGEITEDEVVSERDSLREEVESFRQAHRYFGDDLGPALVVHGEIEDFLAVASRYLDNADDPVRHGGSAPGVGEMLDAVESARASLESARHLADRYRQSLSDPQDFGHVFEETASSLSDIVEARRDDYPDDYGPTSQLFDDFDRPIEDTPAAELLVETFIHLHYGVEGIREAVRRDRVANALLEAHVAERSRRAFEAAKVAVRRGEYGTLQSAAEVRDEKLAALEALESARSDHSSPDVTRRALTDVAHRVDRGDRYLERSLEDDTHRSARNALGQYAFVAYTARETPNVSAWLLGAMRAALGESAD
ncbi:MULTISPECIES: hypothetical protein [Haloferax]|uniref:Uncharacterized protein n=2 Tax=Haloferax TaxID=2251 RepID=A0A6G1Z6Y3_9EURY|nr:MULTISPECIES: hypothetical protein [Haloferax]KAB1185058.1 hypothetical protein Hfx1149_16175 [Haloferax sp. CBA1149]MRW82235.1 hypothetical protein [Haloferax marinisediminis]